METKCIVCGGSLSKPRLRRHAWYCSEECKRAHYKQEYHKLNKIPKLPCSTIGTASVYRVIVDLLYKGYQVFQEVGLASCDLGILREGEFLRVEVTTGKYLPSGNITFPPHDDSKYDVLAIVLMDKIIYRPQL